MKSYAYAAIVLALLIGAKLAYSAIYDAGWNAAIIEQEAAIQKAKNEAVAKERKQWENAVAEAEATIVVEEKIVEVVREVEKRIPVVVDRIVEVTPECHDLGSDFAGLLNDQIRAGAGGSIGGADAPAEPDT